MNYQNGYYYNSNNSAPYGNFGSSYEPKDPFVNREARHLARLSTLAGFGVLGFLFTPYVFSFILSIFGLSDFYMSSFSFQMVYGILASVVSVYVSFRLVYSKYSSGDKARCNEYGKPISKKAFWLAVPAGLAVCCLGDFLSGGFSGACAAVGITFKSFDMSLPSSPFEIFIYILNCAVIPAVVEEFAIRGVVMQPLRKYGDRFAIVMSSLIFAIMHGNMQQIPFAFVAGIALGYFAISTGSIWTGIVIHFLNNFLSVILSVINDRTSYGGFLYFYSLMVIIAAGAYCLYKYVRTEHYGLGFTAASPSTKKSLIAAFAAFSVVSYIYSLFQINFIGIYFVFSVLLIVCYVKYKKENEKALNLPPVSGLPKELMTSLYCATPTIIAGIYSLVILTVSTITVSSTGKGYFFAVIGVIFAFSIKFISSVNKSKIIEDKKPYHYSVVILVIMGLLSLLYFAVGII